MIQPSSANEDKPCKGIIVVDTCALVNLSAAYDPNSLVKGGKIQNLPNPTGSYLDILSVLSDLGFKIIIPEAVSLQTTGVLAGNYEPHNIFKIKPKDGSILGKAEIKNFIRALPPEGNIIIAEAGERSATGTGYQDYITQLKEVRPTNRDGTVGKNASSTRRLLRNKSNIQEVDKRFAGYKKGYGVEHCIDVIHSELDQLKAESHPPPIFFASANGSARDKLLQSLKNREIPEGQDVAAITSFGLLRALQGDLIKGNQPYTALQGMGLKTSLKEAWANV